MIVWKILLFIILFITALLFLPIRLRIVYQDQIQLSVGIWRFYRQISPSKSEKKKVPALLSQRKYRKLLQQDRQRQLRKRQKEQKKAALKKAKQAQKQSEKEKQLPPSVADDAPSVISVLIRMIGEILSRFAGKLHVRLVRMQIVVGGENATQIAIKYGILAQSISFLLELLSQNTRYHRVNDADVCITSDFLLAKTKMDLCFVFQLRPFDLLALGIRFIFRFLQERSEQSPKKSKQNV